MAAPNGLSNVSFSPSLLMDPRAMKKQMANGMMSPSLTESLSRPTRHSSEPLELKKNKYDTLVSTPPKFQDDAHFSRANQGQKASNTRNLSQQLHVAPGMTAPDARMLLDPKAFSRNQETHPKTQGVNPAMAINKGVPGPEAGSKHGLDQVGDFGQGSLIERVHNVSHREERPQKKQKVEQKSELDGEEKSKSKSGNGGGGDLSEYVKEKRKEGAAESGATQSAVVDLTTGDDEEVFLVSANQEKEVCYGSIGGAKVQAHAVPAPSPKAFYLTREVWPPIKVSLARHPGKDSIIRVIDPTGFDFGNVDLKTSMGLARIMDSKPTRFRTQARLPLRKRKPDQVPKQDISDYYELVINLYGPKKDAISVGKFLSQRQIYLRTPISPDNGVEIYNPQDPEKPVPDKISFSGNASSGARYGTGPVVRTTEEIRADVIGMFDSLERSEKMPEKEADSRIITPLLTHQKQALFFLTSKEEVRTFGDNEEDNNSLWRIRYRPNGTRTYYNIITGSEEREKPRETLGGVLADMMGLGKTLNMLALIVGSLDDAAEFGKQDSPETDGELTLVRNSKSTLLVAPLSTLANWEQQIAAHIKPGTLNCYVYHGPSRITNVDELAKFDMVITTYATISSEYSRRTMPKKRTASPLLATNFFRIILDEAHAIREQSTMQSQAICSLAAQRRWAVTGTPVQNRLDDLGGLIKFLRMQPFSDSRGFAHHILGPFKSADPEILPKLRLLVDSITLRRLKDRIDLPSRQDIIVKLEFSEAERALYDWFAKDSQNKLKIIAHEQKKGIAGKAYAHILRAILRLRLLCAHGRELLSPDDLEIAAGFSADTAIDLEAESDEITPALKPKQAYEMLMLLKESASDKCLVCERVLEVKDEDSEKDELIGSMLPCYHVACAECMEGHIASIEQSFPGEKFTCSQCEQVLPKSFFNLTKHGMEEAEALRQYARENPSKAKIISRYGGPHTKVKALLDHLKQANEDSKSLPQGEHPIKSVVFSGWTTYLDLIQMALEENEISFCRLDGKMARKARNASLEAFRDDPEIQVILVSIGAGGLGLNLTTGSRVFMMEPQFNPAAEQQAVDRVHRLGQKRDVVIHRYIMQDSFEEKMLGLQQKKQNLADLSMNRGKLDKAEAAKKKLDELRSLFK